MSYNVLIIDDDDNNRYSLRALLEPEKIEVYEAADGGEALAILIEKHIDLIIMDVQLPDYNGFQLSKIIGSRKKTESIPIIMASAVFKAQIFMEQGFEVGAVDYILKPINGQILLAKLELYRKLHDDAERLERIIEIKNKEIETLLKAIGEYQFIVNTLTDECTSLVEIYDTTLEFTNREYGPALTEISMNLDYEEVLEAVKKTKLEGNSQSIQLVGKDNSRYKLKSFLLKTKESTKVVLVIH